VSPRGPPSSSDAELRLAGLTSRGALATGYGATSADAPSTRDAIRSPFRLLGQYWDEETELGCTRFRYWDPETGRWCSPDPLGIAGGENLSGFDGAPSEVFDPLGLICSRGLARRELARIQAAMSPDEAKRTTFAVAVVRLPNGKREVWVSAAGQKGIVPNRIAGSARRVIRPGRDRDQSLPHINDAERALLRQARAEGVTIEAIGATRPMCQFCQEALGRQGYTGAIVTDRK
jgi:RHS repeat-associated protein